MVVVAVGERSLTELLVPKPQASREGCVQTPDHLDVIRAPI